LLKHETNRAGLLRAVPPDHDLEIGEGCKSIHPRLVMGGEYRSVENAQARTLAGSLFGDVIFQIAQGRGLHA